MKQAGVAWLMPTLVTTPVPKPAALAHSVRDDTGFPSGSTPMALLYVFTPQARAVPPAAESVTRDDALTVVTNPRMGKWAKLMVSGPLPVAALYCSVAITWLMPMPSPIM